MFVWWGTPCRLVTNIVHQSRSTFLLCRNAWGTWVGMPSWPRFGSTCLQWQGPIFNLLRRPPYWNTKALHNSLAKHKPSFLHVSFRASGNDWWGLGKWTGFECSTGKNGENTVQILQQSNTSPPKMGSTNRTWYIMQLFFCFTILNLWKSLTVKRTVPGIVDYKPVL